MFERSCFARAAWEEQCPLPTANYPRALLASEKVKESQPLGAPVSLELWIWFSHSVPPCQPSLDPSELIEHLLRATQLTGWCSPRMAAATRRLNKEYADLQKDMPPFVAGVAPDENNLFHVRDLPAASSRATLCHPRPNDEPPWLLASAAATALGRSGTS